MPKVLCTLPNASDEISGVKFSAHDKGMLSEDVSAEVAATFASIPGYTVVGEQKAPAAPEADAERAALLARADAIGFKAKSTWGLERLASEVETAEKAKAAADAEAAAKTE